MFNVLVSSDNYAPLVLETMGFSDETGITKYGPGVRDLYIIHYVIEGQGYFNGNAVRAGQGFLISPGMKEEYRPDKNNPWSFFWITTKSPLMKELFKNYNADPETNIFKYDYIGEIIMVVKRMSLCDKMSNSFSMLELFSSVYANQIKVGNGEEKNIKELYFKSAKKYIDANLHNGISVQDVVKFIGISQPYLFNIFKMYSGKSTKRYIDDSKMKLSKNLLLSTELSIAQIASCAGFEDQHCFSKFFFNRSGYYPAIYRMKKLNVK